MKILRDETLVALNDLTVACREAAHRHGSAAEMSDDPALRDRLAALARRREEAADRFAEAMIARDDIPGAPSEELELLEAAATKLRSVLGSDETREALRDCLKKEQRLAEAAAAALRHDLDPRLRETVGALHADTAAEIALLQREAGQD